MIRRVEALNEVKVVIVDDNAAHGAGIKQLLEIQSTCEIAGMFTGANDLLKAIGNLQADIILMDMNMPELDGISAIQQILARKPDIKILALTGYDDPELVFRAMRSGAKGYILKTMITSQLVGAMEEITSGKVFLPPSLATKFFDEFHTKVAQIGKTEITKQALLAYLTSREKEVLTLLTEGITYKGVADKLVISETTVKTHVNNIFQKLQVNDRTQAVLYALKCGLVEPSNRLQAVV